MRLRNETWFIEKYGPDWRDTIDGPGWVPEMDKYLGCNLTPDEIRYNGNVLYGGWAFHKDWFGEVLDFISTMRNQPGASDVYNFGFCLHFSYILKQVFGGESYYNGDHVVTKIDDTYYDISGVVEGNFIPLDPLEEERLLENGLKIALVPQV